MSMED